jgi:hypothetical protein
MQNLRHDGRISITLLCVTSKVQIGFGEINCRRTGTAAARPGRLNSIACVSGQRGGKHEAEKGLIRQSPGVNGNW